MQRGGAGNMGSPRQDAVATGADDDIVPDAARLDARPDEPHHTGVCESAPVITFPSVFLPILKCHILGE